MTSVQCRVGDKHWGMIDEKQIFAAHATHDGPAIETLKGLTVTKYKMKSNW